MDENENIITNGKVVTIADWQDFGILTEWFQNLLSDYATSQKWKKGLKAEDYYEETDSYAYYWIPETVPTSFVVEYGAALKAIEPGDIIEKPNTTVIQAKYVFSEEEIMQHSYNMAWLESKKDETEKERKNADQQYKNKIADYEKKRKMEANRINSGYEMRDQKVREQLDFKRGKKYYKSVDNGEIVMEEPLDEEDKQHR